MRSERSNALAIFDAAVSFYEFVTEGVWRCPDWGDALSDYEHAPESLNSFISHIERHVPKVDAPDFVDLIWQLSPQQPVGHLFEVELRHGGAIIAFSATELVVRVAWGVHDFAQLKDGQLILESMPWKKLTTDSREGALRELAEMLSALTKDKFFSNAGHVILRERQLYLGGTHGQQDPLPHRQGVRTKENNGDARSTAVATQKLTGQRLDAWLDSQRETIRRFDNLSLSEIMEIARRQNFDVRKSTLNDHLNKAKPDADVTKPKTYTASAGELDDLGVRKWKASLAPDEQLELDRLSMQVEQDDAQQSAREAALRARKPASTN